MKKLSPTEIHTAKYYYSVFEAIPEELWWRGALIHRPDIIVQINGRTITEQRCAVGHLRLLNISEMPLQSIFGDIYKKSIEMINDSVRHTAKQNILSAIKQLIDGHDL